MAWDPSTTHQRLTESIATGSALHRNWMESTALEQGLFSNLNLDPARLTATRSNALVRLFKSLHADSGAVALGGPGACPDASSPIDTQRYCVRGDLWQLSALGWLRAGMFAEGADAGRQLHHFSSLGASASPTWIARGTSKTKSRRLLAGSAGQPGIGLVTRSTFDGEAASAAAWLLDDEDELAPQATFAHLNRAVLASSAAQRQQARALSLMGLGALLHVVQDLGLPEHARSDLGAFTGRLSYNSPQDLGSSLVEYARSQPGFVHSILSDAASREDAGMPEDQPAMHGDWADRLIGEESGLASWTAQHFLSPADLKSRVFVAEDQTPNEAAKQLLGDEHGLDPSEVDGARLSQWPADRGYLLSSSGRPLAAFGRDRQGRVNTYFDDVCHREVIAHSLPKIVEVGRQILDQLWPAFPKHELRGEGPSHRMVLHTPANWASAIAHVFVEDEHGQRTDTARFTLRQDGQRSAIALPKLSQAGQRHVIVLIATSSAGHPVAVEQYLPSSATTPAP